MKKLFPGILALLMAFSCFVGCGETAPDSSTPAGSTPPASTPGDSTPDDSTPDEEDPLYALNAVKEVLNGAMIKKNVEMRKDYTVANQWYSWHADETFEITWTVTDAEGNATTNVTIEEGDGENDTVKVNSNLEEDFTYILKGTITDSKGQSVEISFTRKVLKAGEYLPVAITAKPLEDVVYKLHVYQSTLGKDLFFNGDDTAATYYFGTTEDYMEAVDVGVEYIENSDAFNVFFTDANGAKKYIGVQLSEDGAHDNIKATDAPVSSFVWSVEHQTILTHLDVNKNGEASDYYLGNYSDKTTISCSMISYAGGAGNNVGGLVTMVHKDEIPVTDADKVAEEKGKLNVKSTVLGAGSIELPVAGKTYTDVTIAWTEDSDVASIEGGVLTTTAVTEATTVTVTATITSGEVSDTATFTIALNPDVETLNNPVDGTAYNMVIKQYTRGEALYLDGTFGARYLNTTANVADAAKVYVETVDAGFKFYILVEDVKNYLNIYSNADGKDAVSFSADAANVFTYNAEKNAWCTTFGENEYYVGTYNDFNTASASKASYIKPDNTGISQFPLEFVAAAVEGGEDVGGGETPDPTPDPEPEVPAIQTLTIAEAIAKAAEQGAGKYTTEMYYVIGKITEVQNSTYGNVMISDGTNEILVYGMYLQNDDGSKGTRYDKMENKPVVGDTVKLLSVVGMYNTTKQLKDAFLIEITAATDAEKVAVEKDALTLTDAVTGASSIALVANGASRADVAISWEVTAGNEIATISNGKLEITNPTAETTVTVKATITCGESIDSKTFDIVVSVLEAGEAAVTIADFKTLTVGTSYTTGKTTNGWSVTGAAVFQNGSANSGSSFSAITAGEKAICLNGKTSNVGKLTSPILTTGVSKISFNYAHFFGENNGVDITINVKNSAGQVVATHNMKVANASVVKLTGYAYEWVLETAVTEDCTVEVVNNSPSKNGSSNKDRVAIWNFAVTGVVS